MFEWDKLVESYRNMKEMEENNITFDDNDDYFLCFDNGKQIGGCNFTIGSFGSIMSEYSDSVGDFDEWKVESILGHGGRILNIEDIWVNKEYRNQGYSSIIIDHAIDIANSNGVSKMMLRAYSDECIPVEVLEHIYSKHGFKPVQRTSEDGTIMVRA